MPKFKEVYSELAKRAEDKGVKIAFENCPMGGTWDKVTCNIAINPRAWEMMFNEVDSPAIGLEWEPAHQLIQLIDPIAQLRKWVGKVVHVHGKDASVDMAAVREYGVLCNTDWYAPERTVGFGDTDWRDIFSILHKGGYEGDICVEGYHDPVYSRDWEMVGQLHALEYLKFCRGGEFVENPWGKDPLFG
jgi:sugar phosphate isomerase/epimerase